jgi:L-lactate dehydrogenase (cytochrome)
LFTEPKITCVEDFRRLAVRRVPRMFYDYADSGSWTEGTYRSNEEDFQKLKLRQRVAVDIDKRSIRSTMIGHDVAMPVAIAPTGLTGMQHADGEILGARAAERFGIPFTLSTMSVCSIEDIAEHTHKPFWFQLYVMRDRDFIERLIDRAKAANCSALVVTLDLQVLGQRHKDIKNGLSSPAQAHPGQFDQPGYQATLVHEHAGHAAAHLRQYSGSRQRRGRPLLALILDRRAV